jgi:HlyD family secretion protein
MRAATIRRRNAALLLAACGLLAAALAAAMAGCSLRGAVRPADAAILSAPVKHTDFQLEVHATGVLRAIHSVSLGAPPIGGGTLQIIRLLSTGTPVKAGQVVVAFDPSQQEYNLAQSRSDFEQAQQAIVQARDNAAVQSAEDKTALLKAQFAVRQAQLKVGENPLLSAIDAKKNLLALDQANRALAETEHDIQSHAASNQAAIAIARQKRAKAQLAMTEARRNIASMQVRSPLDGLVVIGENRNASGGIFFTGMTLPDYQTGDQVNPGAIVEQVVDIDHMKLAAQIGQAARSNIHSGDRVRIRVDAIPGATFTGKVTSIAGMSANPFFSAGLHPKIGVNVRFDHPDPRLRPGYSAHLVIFGRRLKNVLTVPREAVFDLTGSPSVYLKQGSGFARRHVKVRYLSDSTAVIAGVPPGTAVALANPEQQNAVSTNKSDGPSPTLGPGGR